MWNTSVGVLKASLLEEVEGLTLRVYIPNMHFALGIPLTFLCHPSPFGVIERGYITNVYSFVYGKLPSSKHSGNLHHR